METIVKRMHAPAAKVKASRAKGLRAVSITGGSRAFSYRLPVARRHVGSWKSPRYVTLPCTGVAYTRVYVGRTVPRGAMS